MHLFWAVLGLHCGTGISLLAESRGQLSSCDARASHGGGFSVRSTGSWAFEHRLSSCGAWAWLPGGMWDPDQGSNLYLPHW